MSFNCCAERTASCCDSDCSDMTVMGSCTEERRIALFKGSHRRESAAGGQGDRETGSVRTGIKQSKEQERCDPVNI
jgi:hypothetical protein